MLVDDGTVSFEMLIQHDARMGAAQQLGERLLACFDWLAPQIFAVEVQKSLLLLYANFFASTKLRSTATIHHRSCHGRVYWAVLIDLDRRVVAQSDWDCSFGHLWRA